MSTAFRVLGVDLPPKKPVMVPYFGCVRLVFSRDTHTLCILGSSSPFQVALRKIYGVGDFVSMNICAKLGTSRLLCCGFNVLFVQRHSHAPPESEQRKMGFLVLPSRR